MAFPGPRELDLLLSLQQCVDGDGGWSAFLARLADLTDAGFAAIVRRPAGAAGSVTVRAATPRGRPTAADPSWLAAVLTDRLRPERIYDASELVDLGVPADGPIRAMRIVVPGVVSMVLGVFAMHDFAAEDGAVLRRLFPYLQATARLAAVVAGDRRRAAITAGLARSTSRGWFLLDLTGHVIDMSFALRDLPCAIRLLPGPSGDRLRLDDRPADMALAAALDHIATGAAGRVRAIPLGQAHLRVVRAPAIPDAPVALALATLHGESRLLPEAADLIVDLFGLLPSEARLAVALGQGASLTEAADRLGLTIETVRTYSKAIFAKTATRGQAGLVRLLYANGLAGSESQGGGAIDADR